VISLSKEVIEYLGLKEGVDVSVDFDRGKRQIVISSVETPLALAGVDESFAWQVTEFIRHYRPALEALASQ
jgi:hypothetical protein